MGVSEKHFCIFISFLYAAFLHFYFSFLGAPSPYPPFHRPTSFSRDRDIYALWQTAVSVIQNSLIFTTLLELI